MENDEPVIVCDWNRAHQTHDCRFNHLVGLCLTLDSAHKLTTVEPPTDWSILICDLILENKKRLHLSVTFNFKLECQTDYENCENILDLPGKRNALSQYIRILLDSNHLIRLRPFLRPFLQRLVMQIMQYNHFQFEFSHWSSDPSYYNNIFILKMKK